MEEQTKKHYIYNELIRYDLYLTNVDTNETITIPWSGAKEVPQGTYKIRTENDAWFLWHDSRYLSGQEIEINTDGTIYPGEFYNPQ